MMRHLVSMAAIAPPTRRGNPGVAPTDEPAMGGPELGDGEGRGVGCANPGYFLAALLVIVGTFLGAWWIVTAAPPEKEARHVPAAANLKKVSEGDLGTITLTEEAEQRLGVQAWPIQKKIIRRVRIYGGEVIVPAREDHSCCCTMQGTLQAPKHGIPQAGQTVTKDSISFRFCPCFRRKRAQLWQLPRRKLRAK